MGGADHEGVQIGQDHHQVFPGCWLPVQLLVARLKLSLTSNRLEYYLIGFNGNPDGAVRLEDLFLAPDAVNEDQLITLEDDHRLLGVAAASAVLDLKLHLSSVGGDFVSKEPLGQSPELGALHRLAVGQVAGLEELEWSVSVDLAFLYVGEGDSLRVAGKHQTLLKGDLLDYQREGGGSTKQDKTVGMDTRDRRHHETLTQAAS